jgi:hypothetical protein
MEDLLAALEHGTHSGGKAKEFKGKAAGYCQNNRHRMVCSEYFAKGLPLASGVVEITCKTMINGRMEGSGMLGSVDGPEAVLKPQ